VTLTKIREQTLKGVVIKSFERYIETHWPGDLADRAFALDALSGGGAYTTVGNYPHTDMLALAGFVAKETQTALPDLIKAFGKHLFHILADAHADMMRQFTSCIEFLASLETIIHRDVRKIYSDPELPRFEVADRVDNTDLHLIYTSSRPFADLAEGLLHGALEYFQVQTRASLTRRDLASDGTQAQFKLHIRP